MELRRIRAIPCDVVHHYQPAEDEIIRSTGNRFLARLDGRTHSFTIPVSASKAAPMLSRLARRALRLDKSNAVLNHARDGLVILYQGKIWFYDLATGQISQRHSLRQSRNALHSGIAVTKDGIFFGEYGSNADRAPVPVWGSRDDGRSWQIVWETEAPCKHIHGVYADPFSDRLWISTGDFAGECYLYSASSKFDQVDTYGDGSQRWRPVSLLFTPDHIFWVMDTQLETPFLQQFDRRTGSLTQHGAFPGPCWYGKQLADGWAVIQTTVEPGPGVASDHAHLYASRDLVEWTEVASFRKDRWPMRWFKSGVIAFADGVQTSRDFVLFGEALAGLDGKALVASLDD